MMYDDKNVHSHAQGVRKTVHPKAQTVLGIFDELAKGHIPWFCYIYLPAEKQ